MGDSITYGEGLPALQGRWSDLAAARTGHEFVNFGISGDTTTGMLARCQWEVFRKGFDAMVWLGGTNDISYTSDYRTAWANTLAVYRQAKACGVELIVGIPLPVIPERIGPRDYYPGRDNEQVAALTEEFGRLLKIYCGEKGIPCANFRAGFVKEDGSAMAELFFDGLHPNEEGHRRMADTLCGVLAQKE